MPKKYSQSCLTANFDRFVDVVLDERTPFRVVEAEVCLAADDCATRLLLLKPANQSVAADLCVVRELYGCHVTRVPFLKTMIVYAVNKRVLLTPRRVSVSEVILTYAGGLSDSERREFERVMEQDFNLAVVSETHDVCSTLGEGM